MIVCVCRNITEKQIIEQIKLGKSLAQIIKYYDLTHCAKCVPYVKELYDKCI
jgi:bacterioferritin-associated ferredoxin